jgi:hypothetical protein
MDHSITSWHSENSAGPSAQPAEPAGNTFTVRVLSPDFLPEYAVAVVPYSKTSLTIKGVNGQIDKAKVAILIATCRRASRGRKVTRCGSPSNAGAKSGGFHSGWLDLSVCLPSGGHYRTD